MVSDLDAFSDTAFVLRLQKLLSMLGSAQPAEAEAARLKLLEHLRQHRLSLTDVSQHLGEKPRPAASFLQGARELGLERQLAIARAARQEAEVEAAQAMGRAAQLHVALERAAFDVGRALQSRARARLVAAAACAFAAVAVVFAVLDGVDRERPGLAARQVPGRVAAAPGGVAARLHLAPGERLGQAAVQDLALRLQPNDDADVRAFLNMGEKVAIERREAVGSQVWLYVRSESAAGFVRAGDILRD